MSAYYPDYWMVVKLNNSNTGAFHHRVFATWVGGYLNGDSWKLNSGITKVVETDKGWEFWGASGSVYYCPNAKHCYRTSGYTGSVLGGLSMDSKQVGVDIEVLPWDTDWMNLELERK